MRKDTSYGALCATSTEPAAKSRNAGTATDSGGASTQHRVGDAGEHRDERGHGDAGLHEGLELAEDLAAAHLDRADLGDAGVDRGAAGGLEVDHDEGDLGERRAEVVERRLRAAPRLRDAHVLRR